MATFDDEGGVDDHNTIHENQLDYETLETLVTELSEKLQYNRNWYEPTREYKKSVKGGT